MILCLATGMFTPIGDTPYTYLIKTYVGITTSYIAEHQPLIIMQSASAATILILIIGIVAFTDTKLRLSDAFMLLGLIMLSLCSRRQLALLIIISIFILVKIFEEFINKNIEEGTEKLDRYCENIIFNLILIIAVATAAIYYFNKNSQKETVDENAYPVEAVKYIKSNLNINNIRLYNQYNYGSYILFSDIKVFIDSRADLYDKVFNNNINVFEDDCDIEKLAKDYEEIFDKYKISHLLIKKDMQLYQAIRHDNNYKVLYEDENFIVYERTSSWND